MSKSLIRASAVVAASTLAMATSAVSAQTAPPTDPADIVDPRANDIVVTGTRSALESAEKFKRDSDVLVDGISADDIGALPDESIADSLVRIPGLTANDNSDGSGFAEVSVRGLGSDLANTTYNGRVLPSTRIENRRLNLGDLPTEGVARAYVQKTADAGTIEGGLGGTIGLESIRPLETRRKGFTIVARAITDDLVRKVKGVDDFHRLGYRGELSYVGRLAENLGVTFSYAHIEQTNANPSATLEAYANKAGRPDVDGDGQLEVVPQNAGVALGLQTQKRDSILATVQWRPVPALTATLDGYYIKGAGSNTPTRFVANLVAGTTQVPTVFDVKNSVVTRYQGYAGNYRAVLNDSRVGTEQYQGGLNLRFDNGGPFQVNFDASYAVAKLKGSARAATALTDSTNAAQTAAGQARPFGYDATDPHNITLNFGTQTADDFAINDLTNSTTDMTDTAKAVRLDFKYDRPLAIFGSMEFGLRVDSRIKENRPDADTYTFGTLAQRPDLDSSYLVSTTNPFDAFQDYIGGPGAIGFPLFDIDKLYALTSSPRAVLNTQPVNDVVGRSTITEDTMAFYYQANVDINQRLTGGIGARFLTTDVTVDGFATTLAANGVVTPLRVKNSYTYLLPSANLRFAITPPLILRAALSETMSRPVFSNMRIGSAVDYSQLIDGNTITRGNPDLKPFTSRNADLSLEWYPDRHSSLAIQGYYKQVKNFIQNQAVEQLVTLPSGQSLFLTVNTSVNDPTQRKFYGVEIIARRDFNFLPGPLKYLGLRADYSHNWTTATDTFASANGQQAVLPPNNFTAKIYNVQLYYSRRAVDVRLAYRYYSPYTRDILNGFQSRPGGTLDLTGNVLLFRGFRAIASIRNLTKTKTYSNFKDYRYPDNFGFARTNIYPGRQFTVGIRGQF